jgi:ribosomal protein L11 methylase PrmA
MKRDPSSFRDPSGFIFRDSGKIYRQINPAFFQDYKAARDAGIYEKLTTKKWLIQHKEIESTADKIILQPEEIGFITYPYEWSFSQYKHAAQLTLKIQTSLLEDGFSLKDASAFNVTFHHGKPIFIDTLSIEWYVENQPWRALKQFSEHFFAPLLLAQKYGSRHLKTLLHNINGIPLTEVKSHLSFFKKLHPTVYSHISLLAGDETEVTSNKSLGRKAQLAIKDQLKILKVLENYISNMSLKENTEWSDYYNQTNYQSNSFDEKKKVIASWVQDLEIERAIDFGGNNGEFGEVILDQVKQLMVCDIDQAAIDQSYQRFVKNGKVQSIVLDLMQPSPSVGFQNEERESFLNRLQEWNPDLGMALALIHHLTLTGNVPFEMSASFFALYCPHLIIEFPDREDSWVQFILDSKRDARHLFDFYEVSAFAKAYTQNFTVLKQHKITGTHRTLFLMQRK